MLVFDLFIFLGLALLGTFFISGRDVFFLKNYALAVFSVLFLYSILLLFLNNYYSFFEVLSFDIIPIQNFFYVVGLDTVSVSFIVLSQFLFMLCILSSFSSINFNYKLFVIIMILIDFFLVNLFSVLDIFFFYICFESILVPMFLLIGIWGTRQRRIHAGLQFFFYTLFGSFFMLAAITILYSHFGTTNICLLNLASLSEERQLFVWFCFFLAFSIKIPMFPFHIWLPEAHVEAPTIGSVILAGILLKLGGYGFFRFVIPLVPFANYYFTPFIFALSTLAILYTSLTAIRQVDLKKIIAYASVSHMNFVVLGLFSFSSLGLLGSIFLMLSHGIVSSGLFFAVGVLYERYHTRLLKYYGGLAYTMPLFSILFFLLILANFSFPGTSNFIGEFLVLAGMLSQNLLCTFFALISIVFTVVYSIWSYNRMFFGFVNSKSLLFFSDVSVREFLILFSCVICSIIFGIFPNLIIHKLE